MPFIQNIMTNFFVRKWSIATSDVMKLIDKILVTAHGARAPTPPRGMCPPSPYPAIGGKLPYLRRSMRRKRGNRWKIGLNGHKISFFRFQKFGRSLVTKWPTVYVKSIVWSVKKTLFFNSLYSKDQNLF